MITLFKSEKTGKIYESKEDLVAAEKAYDDKQAEIERLRAERTARAKEVEDAYKAYIDAGRKYEELKNKFIKDYKSYHVTYTNATVTPQSLFDMFFNNSWPL